MDKSKVIAAVLCLAVPIAAHAAVRVPQDKVNLGRVYRDEPQKIVFDV